VGDGVLEVAVNGCSIPKAARLAFRPEDVHLEGMNGHQAKDVEGIPAVVAAVVPLGPLFRIDLDGGARFQALLLRPELQRLALKPGDRVIARVDPDDLVLVPEGPGEVPLS
jgi:hypothetical protein